MTTFMIKETFGGLTFLVKIEVIGVMIFTPFLVIPHHLYHHTSFFEIYGIFS